MCPLGGRLCGLRCNLPRDIGLQRSDNDLTGFTVPVRFNFSRVYKLVETGGSAVDYYATFLDRNDQRFALLGFQTRSHRSLHVLNVGEGLQQLLLAEFSF